MKPFPLFCTVGSRIREVPPARSPQTAPARLREGQREQRAVLPDHPGTADPIHRSRNAGEIDRIL